MTDTSDTAHTLHQGGVEAAREGRYAKAVELFQRAIAQCADEPAYHGNLGSALLLMGDAEAAISAHHEAIALSRIHTIPAEQLAWHHYNLGTALTATDRLEHAQAAYTTALALNPGFVAAQENLATTLQMRGQYQQAEAAYRRALELAPERPGTHCNLGSVLGAMGRIVEAEACYRRALELTDEPARVFLDLGGLLHAAGRLADAEVAYRRAAAVQPDAPEIHLRLGHVLVTAGRLADAERAHRHACELAPRQAATHDAWGATLLALSRHDDAVRALQTAILLEPDWSQPHYHLGLAFHRSGALDKAVIAYRTAVARDATHLAAWGNLAECLRRTGRQAAAAAAYREVLQRAPDNVAAQHLLAALEGRATDRPPPGYVEDVFDDYAPRFDQHIIDQLGYRVPDVMRPMIDRLAGGRRFEAALDLGCGTGLVGVHLRDIAVVVHGVDVSREMLARAEHKHVYDALYRADIQAFLDDLDIGAPSYDLITAADVFIYVGDLRVVFASVSRRLARGGLFLFTTEDAPGGSHALRATGRYAHASAYIDAIATTAGLDARELLPMTLRLEHERPALGTLYAFERARR